jgi:hypothetical protein
VDYFYSAAEHRLRGALWPSFAPARIIGSDYDRRLVGIDFERFKKSPVFEIVPIARAIIDAIEPGLIYFQ